jgi:hypothetical protein
MAIVGKINPVGIDFEINNFQRLIYDYLTNKALFTKYECYHRAYVNEKDNGTIPEVYIGKNEYKECLMDDKFNVTSFFLISNTTNVSKGMATSDLSLIFQADIRKLYPNILHRADAEFQRDVIRSIEHAALFERLKGIETGVRNVYSELDMPETYLKKVKLDDMSNYHIVKFKFNISYNVLNCN